MDEIERIEYSYILDKRVNLLNLFVYIRFFKMPIGVYFWGLNGIDLDISDHAYVSIDSTIF